MCCGEGLTGVVLHEEKILKKAKMLKSAAVIFVFITLGKSFNVKDYHLLLAVVAGNIL